MKKLKIVLLLSAMGMLSSCDLTQIPGLDKKLSAEDSKAIGAACRHSGRALEDCFVLNPMALQAGVFEGWRDMNDYMTANKIETVEPKVDLAKLRAEGEHASEADKKPETAEKESKATEGHAAAPAGESGGSRPKWEPGNAPPRHADPAAQAPAAEKKAPSRPWDRNKGTDGKHAT